MFVPLFLRLEGKRVIVVGGGQIATRKAKELTLAGADVTIVAPDVAGEVPEGAHWIRRAFDEADLEGSWLVVAATDDSSVQRRLAQAAARLRVFIIAVDDLANASAISPAVVRRGPVTVAISSGGEAPALTRLLRELIEQLLPEDRYVEIARDLRRRWKREGRPMGLRFAELVQALRS
jgi:uroporphyrin-III C-methyltransferase/precorrin-2 dehydrogenase/sirohydrochlorin ferrochelatase